MMMIFSNGGLKVLQEVKPYLYMVLQQFFIAVMYVLAEATLKDGMNQYVLVVYRNIIVPISLFDSYICQCRKQIPRITTVIVLKIIALAFLDPVLQQNFFYMGAKLTSASFAAALENIIPAITYIMALVLRYLQGVVMNEKGPVFVGAFIPLCFFFTMALGSFFLSEKISLGMAIGSIIMVAGLYALLWGNSKDQLSQQNVRDPGEQELSFSTATLVGNSHQPTRQSNILDKSMSV
ncbi:WAT1-related protein At1g21890-like [Dendrobium catenatum]|uniref:WAT1-related protein At1g21890-like n=1 Tax=Dendrobium catenatum TaxID=906689 RepID=UPI0009F48D94|nr:WAT1-related protein At1g21890-like [Dendrobium catenatum]